jgi:NhaA family Na+:H+ antiporter
VADIRQQSTTFRRPYQALRTFFRQETAGGIVLLATAALALLLANSPLASRYFGLLHFTTGPTLAPAIGAMTVHLWINDALMAVFFLLVGLEIKHELVGGALASPARRRLPIIAAGAGMAVPALIYLAMTGSKPALQPGWAIPAATDIAFAIGVLALLGSRVPPALKLFLTTVAIVDDCGAVAIIAFVYSHGIDWIALAGAAGVVLLLFALNRRGVAALWPYLLGFVVLWWLTLLSGVHATVAGVIAAALIPTAAGSATPSPLHRLEHALSPWVAFGIVPLFAFANAGVSLRSVSPETLRDPLVIGIVAGLFLGKQIGILGGVALAERLGIASRPDGVGWLQLYGVALLAGIGFTMSLFIGGLAFPGDAPMQDLVKIGVLAGSILSAIAGYCILRMAAPGRPDA